MAVADAAIEAVVEKVEPKKEAFAVLDEVLPSDALLLTNTTSISITDLASATRRPDKVCGTHFFTPLPIREAVEVPRGLLTSDETVDRVKHTHNFFREASDHRKKGRTWLRGESFPDADAQRGVPAS